jgi:GTP cyclohydrolase IA
VSIFKKGSDSKSEPFFYVDQKKIQYGVRLILEAIGVDPEAEDFKDTPERVARFYKSLPREEPKFTTFTNRNINQLIIVEGIDFYSLCPHHLLVYTGMVAVGYLPTKKYAGLSKLARVVDYLAAVPKTQEDLTDDIARYLQKKLKASAVYVVVRATHSCMSIRGAKKPNSVTITSALEGPKALVPELKAEFHTLLRRSS